MNAHLYLAAAVACLARLTDSHKIPCSCPLCLAFSHADMASHFLLGVPLYAVDQEQVAPGEVALGECVIY
jgi:hypothetical protein